MGKTDRLTAARLGAAEKIIAWQKEFGRQDLPWQKTTDPYQRWLSEIMLQQTQVKTVIPYFRKFLDRFPDVHSLAAASEEEIFELWAGLGYYSRASNLHQCAQQIVERFNGVFPLEVPLLRELAGIGPSTAGAIRSAVTDIPAVVLDGNVKRVLSRLYCIGEGKTETQINRALWEVAEKMLPVEEGRAYAQGLMDLGALVCTRTRPQCERCPLHEDCSAKARGEQEKFPTKKKSKAVPEEQLHMLIVRDGERIYLEQKNEGYWKKLWTLPVAGRAPVECGTPIGAFEHRLTHLKLVIRCYRCPQNLWFSEFASDKQGRWMNFEEIEKGALATPVKAFLLRHRSAFAESETTSR